ncbi:MAG: hypothetical protein M1828_005316 [Chrysothrix sp. TS-e1954]|nr:MAG: hypothetical protein M1828_005316 [Chrysothrix sp. TS-e1954]
MSTGTGSAAGQGELRSLSVAQLSKRLQGTYALLTEREKAHEEYHKRHTNIPPVDWLESPEFLDLWRQKENIRDRWRQLDPNVKITTSQGRSHHNFDRPIGVLEQQFADFVQRRERLHDRHSGPGAWTGSITQIQIEQRVRAMRLAIQKRGGDPDSIPVYTPKVLKRFSELGFWYVLEELERAESGKNKYRATELGLGLSNRADESKRWLKRRKWITQQSVARDELERQDPQFSWAMQEAKQGRLPPGYVKLSLPLPPYDPRFVGAPTGYQSAHDEASNQMQRESQQITDRNHPLPNFPSQQGPSMSFATAPAQGQSSGVYHSHSRRQREPLGGFEDPNWHLQQPNPVLGGFSERQSTQGPPRTSTLPGVGPERDPVGGHGSQHVQRRPSPSRVGSGPNPPQMEPSEWDDLIKELESQLLSQDQLDFIASLDDEPAQPGQMYASEDKPEWTQLQTRSGTPLAISRPSGQASSYHQSDPSNLQTYTGHPPPGQQGTFHLNVHKHAAESLREERETREKREKEQQCVTNLKKSYLKLEEKKVDLEKAKSKEDLSARQRLYKEKDRIYGRAKYLRGKLQAEGWTKESTRSDAFKKKDADFARDMNDLWSDQSQDVQRRPSDQASSYRQPGPSNFQDNPGYPPPGPQGSLGKNLEPAKRKEKDRSSSSSTSSKDRTDSHTDKAKKSHQGGSGGQGGGSRPKKSAGRGSGHG